MKNLMLLLIITALCFSAAAAQERNTPAQQHMQKADLPQDNDFMRKALEGGLSEIRLGELAQSKGSSSQVREFGKMMINDHQKANEELRQLAQQNAYVDLPLIVPSGTQKDYDKLSGKNGADFDKAFARQMVKDHEEIIKLFSKEAENGKDEQLKSWAARTLPILEQHLAQAKKLEEGVKANNR